MFFDLAPGKLFGGARPIPAGPHIIVATTTLIPNWVAEINMWLGGFETFVYTRKNFFHSESAWSMSGCDMHRRIILVSSPVCTLS